MIFLKILQGLIAVLAGIFVVGVMLGLGGRFTLQLMELGKKKLQEKERLLRPSAILNNRVN